MGACTPVTCLQHVIDLLSSGHMALPPHGHLRVVVDARALRHLLLDLVDHGDLGLLLDRDLAALSAYWICVTSTSFWATVTLGA
mmetsp:Transcript_29113/g.91944  ORF Transcript_29113/g.91944 Transcript_29113/m.91944 type:complete len:84 (+) Transcript_29113:210-461(+)